MSIPFYQPSAAPAAALRQTELPLDTANPISRLFYQWLGPIMKIGYSRPLEEADLWSLPDRLQCQVAADHVEALFNARLPPSMRLDKYKPDSWPSPSAFDAASGHQSEKTRPPTSQIENQETLLQEDAHTGEAAVRAEVSDELALTLVDSQLSRRGSDSTIYAAQTETTPTNVSPASPHVRGRFWQRKVSKRESGRGATEDGVFYDMSYVRALFMANVFQWGMCVAILACSNTLSLTAPLITRLLLREVSLANAVQDAETAGLSTADLERPRPLYHSWGLALSLFAMLFVAGVSNAQFYFRAQCLGYLMHGATIDLVSRKSMRLSGRARNTQTSGRINTLVANDAGYLEFMAPALGFVVVQPLIIVAGIGLLIWSLGYSALVGVGILVGFTPLVGKMFNLICSFRQAQANALDRRVRVMSEVLTNMRAIKVYAFETFLGRKVQAIRQEEIDLLRRYGVMRASINSIFDFVPVVAIVLTFITYSLTGHELSPEVIFPALQFFNIVGAALRRLPLILSNILDARVSFRRISEMLVAEELVSKLHIDEESPYAIDMEGNFQFDSVAPPDQGVKKSDMRAAKEPTKKDLTPSGPQKPNRWWKKSSKADTEVAGGSESDSEKSTKEQVEKEPFALRDIKLKIARGSLVCVVGRVGSGKTALFSSLINEMRRLNGNITFGGPVSLVPQHAWVKSGSVRENIVFSARGDEVNDDRVQEVIEATGLRPDVDMWQDGEFTEIGERGITLSGGQRQRICIARAAYDDSDIVLLDDPLSAVDANVGHHLLHKCILSGPLAHRTRLLVTHHLDVLPRADWLIVLDRNDANEGRIIQQGTYQDLLKEEGVFQTLIQEYGSAATANASSVEGESDDAVEKAKASEADDRAVTGGGNEPVEKQKGGKLMLDEERETGEIAWTTYGHYLKAIGTLWWSLIILITCLAVEATRVTNNLFLGFWASDHFEGLTTGAYMGIYAGLAGAIAVFTWICTYTFIIVGNRASFKMFNDAWNAVMRSPTGWHDRTPTGRVISRLSKDVQMMDNRLAQTWLSLIGIVLSIFGLFALIVYTFPWLGLIFIPIGAYLYILSSYYRRTTREVKRIHSLLRSLMYNCLQEQLAGLAVIRAFGQQPRFEGLLQAARAHFIMDALEVWAASRVECVASVLILAVGLFGACFRDTVNPSQFGVTLSFLLGSMTNLKELVPTWALCEQQMNAVERVQHYRELETEAAATLPSDPKPDEEWPTQGAVSLTNVQLKYRPDLPLVLKGLTFHIKPAEKIGIIGRTGAGKSSIAQALFRTVELCGGRIEVDGRDLRDLGLDVVRGRLSIIPQDAFLFSGTVRENVDPTGIRSDAELNSAMSLIHRSSSSSVALKEKFKLDAPVSDNGTNFSAGERQLLSLMRALARGCKVLLLDEATSSVDPETDALIQKVIQTEFADVTLISIAHRLQTVAFYDRILVMDAGQIAEFDTPLNLFDRPDSIFRSLCEKKSLGREDIVRIQQEAARAGVPSEQP